MKVAVWNYYTFSFVGSYEIAGDFSPCWDLLTPQNSLMKIAGDCAIEKMMVVAVPNIHGRTFIGIVSDVKKSDSGITEVTVKEITSILDIPIVTEMFSDADYASGPNYWLSAKASDYFGDLTDLYQRLSWLTFSAAGGTAKASPAWSSNETSTLLSAMEEFVDAYGTMVKFTLASNNTSIGCEFTYSSLQTKYTFDLRTDCFSEVVYTDNSETAVNKVVFKPMTDNYINTGVDYPYVLLSNGSISTDLNDVNRLTPVVSQIEFYSDEDLGGVLADTSSIAVTASEILNVSKYSHEVKFKMRRSKASSYLRSAFSSILCGTLLTLYGVPGNETTAIESKVTRIQVTGDDEIEVTCGYSRSQLTDKIKMRERVEKGGKQLCYGIVQDTVTIREDPIINGSVYDGSFEFTLPKRAIIIDFYVDAVSGAIVSGSKPPHGPFSYRKDNFRAISRYYLNTEDPNYPVDNGDGTLTHQITMHYDVDDWVDPTGGPHTYRKFEGKVTYIQLKTLTT